LETGGGHTLDALEFILGDTFKQLTAILSNQQAAVTIHETGAVVDSAAPNHMIVAGIMHGGAAVAVHNHASKRNAAHTWIEIAGSDGDLRLVSVGGATEPGVQGREFRLAGARGSGQRLKALRTSSTHRWVPKSVPRQPVLAVAQQYAQFVSDIRRGSSIGADFSVACRLHMILATISKASVTGCTQVVP
jgi:predicted dehydrogenase